MKKHSINKGNALNDMILTVSLILAVIFTELFMHATRICAGPYKVPSFFIVCFIFIKIVYHAMRAFLRKFL